MCLTQVIVKDMSTKKTLLMILDGWGLGNGDNADVISQVPTPNMDRLKKEYPSSQLFASGENVGLPDGQMGNSEVGHLNIGAGRVVYQDLVKINRAVKDGSISENPALVEAFSYARDNQKQVHFMGLLSDGGVHSLDKHLYELCDMTGEYGIKDVFIHAFGDGRDTDPQSGKGYMEKLEKHLADFQWQGWPLLLEGTMPWTGIIAGKGSRKLMILLVHGKGRTATDVVKAFRSPMRRESPMNL